MYQLPSAFVIEGSSQRSRPFIAATTCFHVEGILLPREITGETLARSLEGKGRGRHGEP